MFKKIILLLLIVFIAIQFFRPEKNVSAQPQENDIVQHYNVPNDVQNLLYNSCYDCHSNNTQYPWYNNIQPVAWWLNNHVKDGKKHLNFNEFGSYSLRRQYHKMEEVIEMVKEDEMPLSSYTLIHGDARLTEQDKAAIVAWAGSVMDTLRARYPMDSLVQKK